MKNLTLSITIILFLIFLTSCKSAELKEERKQVRAMPINHVNLSELQDGVYKGDFSYGRYTYIVELAIRNHNIEDIVILQNRTKKRAKMAEGVVPRILEQQKNDVDVVTGATTTSKALLKAIENALTWGLEQ